MKWFLCFLTFLSTMAFAQLPSTTNQYLPDENLIKNPGFENSLSGWAKTGSSTFATTSSSGWGERSLQWDPSTTGEELSNRAITPKDALQEDANCLVSMWYQWTGGTSGDIEMVVEDSGGDEVVNIALDPSSSWREVFASFNCPASGQIQFLLKSTANAAAITIDNVWMGSNNRLTNLSQAELFGTFTYNDELNCFWSSTSASYANFAVDSDCSDTTATGSLTAPDTVVPGFKVESLPPGKYVIDTTFKPVNGSSTFCNFRIHDGTAGDTHYARASDTGVNETRSWQSRFEYTSAQSNVTFQIQSKRMSGAGACQIDVRDDADSVQVPLSFFVYRFPLESELAVSIHESPGVASVEWVGNAAFAQVSAASWTTFSAAAFSAATKNYIGKAKTETTNNVQLTYEDMPAGKYLVEFTGWMNAVQATSTTTCIWAIYDSTNRFGHAMARAIGTSERDAIGSIGGIVEYSTMADRTFLLQGYREGGGGTCDIDTGGSERNANFRVVRLDQQFPQAYTLPTMLYQTEYCDVGGGSYISGTGNMSVSDASFKFSNLVSGQQYRISFHPAVLISTGTQVAVEIKQGATVISLFQLRDDDTGNTQARMSTVTTLFESNGSDIEFNVTQNGTSGIYCDGTSSNTWAQLEYLPHHRTTTQW